MSEQPDSIIRKIQKLLALSQSGNEAEAALALGKAQELLAQHNLDYSVVQDAMVPGGTNQPAPEKREKRTTERSAMYKWQRDLWKAIAEANFCWWSLIEKHAEKNFYGKSVKWVKRHLILGRESNVIAVQMMGEYLCDTIERLVTDAIGGKELRHSRSANSWRKGCAERLVERIEEQADARKNDTLSTAKASDGALVLLRDVYEHEYRANYDFKHGEGAYGRKLIRDAEWEAGQEEREKRADEYRAQKEREWLEYLKNETPEQKKARERKEEKERIAARRRDARYSRSYWSEHQREASRIDREAYRAGKAAAENINLSNQIKDNRERRLG